MSTPRLCSGWMFGGGALCLWDLKSHETMKQNGKPFRPVASHCLPKTHCGPKISSLGMEGEPLAQPHPLGHIPSRHTKWVTHSPCSSPQAQVCSSKRRQQGSQSMSSEERTAALTPKQTHGSPAFPAPPKPSAAAAATAQHWLPLPTARPYTTDRPLGYDLLGCFRQLSPAQAEFHIGVLSASLPTWHAEAEESRGHRIDGSGEVCISTK